MDTIMRTMLQGREHHCSDRISKLAALKMLSTTKALLLSMKKLGHKDTKNL